ncbi:HEAT repeat domain-containing protein [Myceligenerans indicum]|uniref:HEAT repeat domain-containing protein n=1 Tax=Myceligenerans indicum TaxID=2593663 RepID=A0ABS1LPE3_9MICO|nr:HEAT repeat domain-containing protein [Myceligenerans indicum]MBL0888130.1 HEAT repeat domain-containing protein [Myceligenerans indicum]
MNSTTSSLINEVNWARLTHAYGVATDAPGSLRALVQDDDEAFGFALDYLYSAVLHQGTVYPATAPSLRAVAEMLDQDIARRPAPDSSSRLAGLLGWIDAVAESASWCQDLEFPDVPAPSEEELAAYFRDLENDDWSPEVGQYLEAQAAAALPGACASALPAVGPFLTDADDDVRLAALDAYVRLAALQEDKAAMTAPLSEALKAATARDERARLVLGLGDLAGDTTAWLSDDDPAVRACAAMALPRSPEATAILVDLLQDPLAADEWFDSPPSRFDIRVHFDLLANLLARDITPAEVLPACLAAIRVARGGIWSDMTWGPILAATFPGVVAPPGARPEPPASLDEPQRAVLGALVENDALWDPRDGNARRARRQVGLPDEREEVARLIGA